MRAWARFWSKVDRSDPNGCWPWTAAKVRGTYGAFWVGGSLVYAHRFAYSLMVGEVPSGMDLDHRCHNRACVNPAHLRLATRSQNLCNQKRRSDNSSGFKGVSWHAQKAKWVANINLGGKRQFLGLFEDPQKAHAAYCQAASTLHGQFANSGVPCG